MLTLDPDFLRTFLAISDTGGFASAAQRVNKTQSTVSAQMRRLEEALQVELFTRSGRRSVLTTEGRKLMEYARAMVRLNDETIHAFRPPEVSGTIKIGTTDDYAQAFLPETLASFARSHPGVQVEIVTASSQVLEPGLNSDGFDAVILLCEQGDPDMEVLRTDQLHWIGVPSGSAQYQDPMPLALWADGCAWRAMALAALAAAGKAWRIAYTTSNTPLLSATVKSQLGVTVAPEWFVTDGLHILADMDQKYPLGKAEIGIKLSDSERSPALEAFLCHLRERISPAIGALTGKVDPVIRFGSATKKHSELQF